MDVISRTDLGTRFTVSFPESHVVPGTDAGMNVGAGNAQAAPAAQTTPVAQTTPEITLEARPITAQPEAPVAPDQPERVEAEIVSEPAGNLVGVRMEAGPGIELVLEPKVEKIENPFTEQTVPGFGTEESEQSPFESLKSE